LVRLQGVEVSHTRFDTDVRRLTHTLRLWANQLRQREAAEAARQAEDERRTREAAETARAEEAKRHAAAEEARRVDEEGRRREAEEERARQEAAEAARVEARRLAEAEAAQRMQDERRVKEAAETARAEEAQQQAAAGEARRVEEERRTRETEEERARQEAAEAARAEEAQERPPLQAAKAEPAASEKRTKGAAAEATEKAQQVPQLTEVEAAGRAEDRPVEEVANGTRAAREEGEAQRPADEEVERANWLSWRETILSACERLDVSNILIGSAITDKAIEGAKKYLAIPEYETLLMIDQSKGVKSSIIVFGLCNLYWRNIWSKPRLISWARPRHCKVVEGLSAVKLGKNMTIITNNVTKKQLISLLDFLKKQPNLPHRPPDIELHSPANIASERLAPLNTDSSPP
jgi:chemotaxis protein histidine kinase CheA